MGVVDLYIICMLRNRAPDYNRNTLNNTAVPLMFTIVVLHILFNSDQIIRTQTASSANY